MSDSFQPHGLQPAKLLHPWDFPGKSTGVGCQFLLQEIFQTQGLNLGLVHCRQMLYHLRPQGSPIFAVLRMGNMAFGITFWKTKQDVFFFSRLSQGSRGRQYPGCRGVWDGAGLRGRQC